MAARAFWTMGRGVGELREEVLRSPGASDVVVDALYSGISRGTEALVFHGRVPVSEHQRMRAPHQAGEFPFPVKYGYLSVGRVAQGPAALLGKAVFCLYPHQSRYVVAADQVVPLPDGVPAARAVLAGNLETAINAVWDAELRVGDRVAVVGGGVVGCLVAYLAGRMVGCAVELVDLEPGRAAVAAALGVGFSTPDRARSEADVVIHSSGQPAGLATAISLAGQESTVVELSWYGDQLVPLPLGGAFHARRLRLVSSQVGELLAAQRARWTRRRRLELALALLVDARFDILIDQEGAFEDLPTELPRLTSAAGSLCYRVRYGQEA